MRPEDKFPAITYKTAPLSNDEAAARISNHCANGIQGILGLIFSCVEQFRAGLIETGLVVRIDGLDRPLMKSEGAMTYQVIATVKDGSIWRILLNQLYTESEMGPLEVINVGCKEKAQTGGNEDA